MSEREGEGGIRGGLDVCRGGTVNMDVRMLRLELVGIYGCM